MKLNLCMCVARRLPTLFAGMVMCIGFAMAGCVQYSVAPEPVSPGRAPGAAALDSVEAHLADDAVSATPVPLGAVTYYESRVSLPTYPYEQYQTDTVDPATGWPLQSFDRERFLEETPGPRPHTYRTIVLENAYLEVTILPELGGRIWQVVHKSSGNRMFYQNDVVKPSPWGPANQLGWLALGGLEWGMPVIEHGYEWGTAWAVSAIAQREDAVSLTVSMPAEGKLLDASVTISLHADAATLEIEPVLSNPGSAPVEFDYWHTAMLAPGPGNSPSGELHFVFPSSPQMSLHSTGDPSLPSPGRPFTWPIYKGRDLSRLGNWEEYLGFFEYPSAHGPFVGVYDRQYDAGAVRIFPAETVRGSKAFGLGWGAALDSAYYTDDGSAYVELHAGLAPTFFESYRLPAGESIGWREIWYPVQGIGDLLFANDAAAMNVQAVDEGWRVGFYPTRPMDGAIVVTSDGAELAREPIAAGPNEPFRGVIVAPDVGSADQLGIRFEDDAGRVLLEHGLQ